MFFSAGMDDRCEVAPRAFFSAARCSLFFTALVLFPLRFFAPFRLHVPHPPREVLEALIPVVGAAGGGIRLHKSSEEEGGDKKSSLIL